MNINNFFLFFKPSIKKIFATTQLIEILIKSDPDTANSKNTRLDNSKSVTKFAKILSPRSIKLHFLNNNRNIIGIAVKQFSQKINGK